MFRLLFLIFCFFSATGNFPIDLFGLKAGNAYTLLYCALIGLYLLERRAQWRPLRALFAVSALFIVWQFASSTWADDFAFSAYRAFVVSGFVFLALALPIVAAPRSLNMVQIYGQMTVVASALLIVCYVLFLSPGARGVYPQLFLPSLSIQPLEDFDLNDPNIVACALSVGLICTLASQRRGGLRLAALAVCTLAIVLTQSRTALVFLPVAALVAGAVTRNWRAVAWSLAVIAVAAATALAVIGGIAAAGVDPALMDAVEQRLSSDTGSNEDRLERLAGAFQALTQPGVAIFGIGAGGSIASGLEPHNMFISFLLELGLLGFVLFCAIFACTASLALRWCRPEMRFYAMWMLFFIFFACLTYWHTRTLWFSLSLVIFSALNGRYSSAATPGSRRASNRSLLQPVT